MYSLFFMFVSISIYTTFVGSVKLALKTAVSIYTTSVDPVKLTLKMAAYYQFKFMYGIRAIPSTILYI